MNLAFLVDAVNFTVEWQDPTQTYQLEGGAVAALEGPPLSSALENHRIIENEGTSRII